MSAASDRQLAQGERLPVVLLGRTQLDLDVPLPDVRAALVMKAHAYAGRLGVNDALDIWRLLQAASNSGHAAADGPTGSTARDAAVILHRHFAVPSGSGLLTGLFAVECGVSAAG